MIRWILFVYDEAIISLLFFIQGYKLIELTVESYFYS